MCIYIHIYINVYTYILFVILFVKRDMGWCLREVSHIRLITLGLRPHERNRFIICLPPLLTYLHCWQWANFT